MAVCAVTGQTVITGYYCLYQADDPDIANRFFALESPVRGNGRARDGEEATRAARFTDVASEIARLGPGVLRLNQRTYFGELNWPLPGADLIGLDDGGYELVEPLRIRIETDDVAKIEERLRLGGVVKVAARIVYEDLTEQAVQLPVALAPAFAD